MASLFGVAVLAVVADRLVVTRATEAPRRPAQDEEHRLAELEAAGMLSCDFLKKDEWHCVADVLDYFGDSDQPPELNCLDYFDKRRRLMWFRQRRHDFAQRLVFRLGNGHPLDTRCAAAYLLGVFREASAVEALLDHIDMESRHACLQTRIEFDFPMFPAAAALQRIGPAAVEPTLERLATPGETGLRRELELDVIRAIEGTKERTLRRLWIAQAMETDPARRAALQWAAFVAGDDPYDGVPPPPP